AEPYHVHRSRGLHVVHPTGLYRGCGHGFIASGRVAGFPEKTGTSPRRKARRSTPAIGWSRSAGGGSVLDRGRPTQDETAAVRWPARGHRERHERILPEFNCPREPDLLHLLCADGSVHGRVRGSVLDRLRKAHLTICSTTDVRSRNWSERPEGRANQTDWFAHTNH